MNPNEEDIINDYLEGNVTEEELTDSCKKIINMYQFIIKKYFSCEDNVINNVKNKLIENFRL